MAGFTSAEGSLLINIKNSRERPQVILRFKITQHERDEILLKSFVSYFNCGYYLKSNQNVGIFQVEKFLDITEKIIPFFKNYPICGVKALDFSDFCKCAELMKNKVHLTQEGLQEIKKIKTGMNKGRIWC